jgi:hypothetical protein
LGSHRRTVAPQKNIALPIMVGRCHGRASQLWVMNDKTHSEHNESADTPTPDIRADIVFLRANCCREPPQKS